MDDSIRSRYLYCTICLLSVDHDHETTLYGKEIQINEGNIYLTIVVYLYYYLFYLFNIYIFTIMKRTWLSLL